MAAPTTIWGWLEHHAERVPQQRAVACDGEWLTYAALHDRAHRVADGLRGLGVQAGDRVAFLLPNRLELILLVYAINRLGAIQVPLNVFLKGEFLRHQLEHSGASIVVVDDDGADALAALAERPTGVRTVVTVGRPVGGLVSFAALERAPVGDVPAVDGDIFAIMYTSGTTGLPKGCVHGSDFFLAIPEVYVSAGWLREGDVVLSGFPLFHAGGQNVLLCALRLGVSAAFTSAFSASGFLPAVRDMGATVFWGVAAMGTAILAAPERPDDRDNPLERAFMIPLAADRQEEFEARFGADVICECFGQTEIPTITLNPLDRARKRGTAGRAAPMFEVAVVDEHDRVLPAGEAGEIVVRSRRPGMVFRGYWNDPESTLQAWRNLWHHTGDFGTLDADGCLTFVDRKGDRLRRRGENVSSVALEAVFAAHPKLLDVAVHAVPSPMGEDDIKLCATVAAGESVEPEELFEYMRAQLPYFAIPRYVEVLDELPKNSIGRVLKHELRARGVGTGTWDFESMGLVVSRADRRRTRVAP